MRRIALSLAFPLLLVATTANAEPNHVRTRHVDAVLFSELKTLAPHSSFWVGLRFKIRPGWHTYWLNPGDSGLAASIEWELPEGIAAGAIRWPIPQRFPFGHLMNYGYSDEVVLLTRMSTWPAIAVVSTAKIAANAQWLVCEDVCILERGRFELDLPVAAGEPVPDADAHALIEKYAKLLPAPARAPAQFFTNDNIIRLRVPVPKVWLRGVSEAWFFPHDFGVVDHAALQRANSYADGFELTLTRGDLKHERLKRLRGVLVLRYGEKDRRGLSVDAQPG